MTFHKVWFLPEKNTWQQGNLLAYRDVGRLIVEQNHLEFVGRRHNVSISSIKKLGFGVQGRDFINNWVRIDSGEKTVYFADGGWLGFRGHLAHGTREILQAILSAFPTTDTEQFAASNRSAHPGK